ncbi:hypothetical protein HHI36_002139 [Cryptolaemus montrouzieri]|uniref:DDE Tnp4 domain-containing protein n=1 Tax=Cryptolaemus montrouzieri TaxID=559131 RepID=A0ABD2PAA0_9CUCU
MSRFVPINIGLQAITRNQYINNHVSELENILFNEDENDPEPIVFMDGTYFYIVKSTPDGFILDRNRPYFSDSRNNDAAMLRHVFGNYAQERQEWLKENAILIVDRGYKDVIPLLDELGIEHRMPAVVERGSPN